jgi:hypothetical protein
MHFKFGHSNLYTVSRQFAVNRAFDRRAGICTLGQLLARFLLGYLQEYNSSPPFSKGNTTMHRFHFRCLLMAGTVALLSLAVPCIAQTNADLWDVTQGSVVTANSPVRDNGPADRSSPRDMFGATEGSIEPGHTLFGNQQSAGFVHFVEWQTPTPIRLDSFKLYAIHDGAPSDANQRGFSRFNLLAKNPTTQDFELIYTFEPTNPYTIIGPNFLLVDASVTPTIAQDFRAEFVQFGDSSPSQRGPRVVELDGFGVVPAPGALVVALMGAVPGATLLLRRRK